MPEERCAICQATATHPVKSDVPIEGKYEFDLCDYCFGFRMGRQHTTEKPKAASA